MDGDRNKYRYHSFCDIVMHKYNENVEEQSKFCLKLVRNLGCYPLVDNPYFDPKNDRCKILHYWIYNSIKNQRISNSLITECFDDYKGHMNGTGKTPNCHYYSYDDIYKDPVKMIKLEIFQSNINTVTDMLNKENKPLNHNLQNYICECVNIYKEMDKNYCRNNDDRDHKRELTCSTLKSFKTTYESFLSKNTYKNYKIPSLDDVENEYKNNCVSPKPKLPTTALRGNDEHALPTLIEDSDGQSDEYSTPKTFTDENQGSYMSRTVSTAVGTMAGASSILALLYKFTPGRNWMRSDIRGSRGRISNTLHAEQPNELFYDGFEGEVMGSYNPTYNVGYGSA
ncbi:VIR protein [Plasmodium vivax]|uniref:VIR protein n=1 Tax=Plasmodium vivax TaxID=5855 RepID=A0A1G4EEE5_PLAVI|nr:VIR protein [Plasmodium vivax]